MKYRRFLTNTYNPKAADAPIHVHRQIGETVAGAWRWHLYYLKDKHIGPPMPTTRYTRKQLQAMNMVGVYTKGREPKNCQYCEILIDGEWRLARYSAHSAAMKGEPIFDLGPSFIRAQYVKEWRDARLLDPLGCDLTAPWKLWVFLSMVVMLATVLLAAWS